MLWLARCGLPPRPRIGTPKEVNASASGDTPLVPAAAGRHIIVAYLLTSNRDASAITVAFNWGGGDNFFSMVLTAGQVVVQNLIGCELCGPANTAFNINLAAGGDVLATALYMLTTDPIGD